MKDYLKNVIAQRDAEIKELEQRNNTAESVEEIRSIGKDLTKAMKDKAEAEKTLRSLEEKEATETRAFDPLATFGNVETIVDETRETSIRGSMEYRLAFKEYVQRGKQMPAEFRAGGDTGVTVTADIGAIVPDTILKEFIKEVSKKYGQVYDKVRKLNIPGGVRVPIAQLMANFHWISETAVSEKQKAGDIKEFITFSYHVGEVRVAQSFLSEIVALDMFESEIVRIMLEAFLKAMDNGILAGTGEGQLLGITNDPRVKNVVTLTEAEFADWQAWRKKLFAKVPLSKRGQGEFLFTPATVESYLYTMKDGNDRPLFFEAAGLNVGNLSGSFFGRQVTLVEPDVVKDVADASAGDIIGVFWNPSDYAINTNFAFGIKRYSNEDTNEHITKGLIVVDGKILDPSGCYIIKKGA